MLWKLLLTVAIVCAAYWALRTRALEATRRADAPSGPEPLRPRGAWRFAAYGLVIVMLAGLALYLLQDWRAGAQVVQIQVVNANTGAVTLYQARRRELGGRGFRTLDGQQVRLADVERMIVSNSPAP